MAVRRCRWRRGVARETITPAALSGIDTYAGPMSIGATGDDLPDQTIPRTQILGSGIIGPRRQETVKYFTVSDGQQDFAWLLPRSRRGPSPPSLQRRTGLVRCTLGAVDLPQPIQFPLRLAQFDFEAVDIRRDGGEFGPGGIAHLTGAGAVSLGVCPSTRILQQFRGRPIGESCCSRSRSEHPLNQNRASAAISCVQRQHSISLRSIGIDLLNFN